MIFNTEKINEINSKINNCEYVPRNEIIYLRGEYGIRKSGVQFSLSNKELEEYVKCASDINYFVKFLKIRNPKTGLSNIVARGYQEEYLNLIFKNKYVASMLTRQSGATLIHAISILHTLLFSNNKNIMVVTNRRDTSVELLDKIKGLYMHLPFYMKTGVNSWSQTSISFENGCKLKAGSRVKIPPIGFEIDNLYIFEFGHIDSSIIEPFYTSVIPTLSKNGKILINSTSWSKNKLFKKLFEDDDNFYKKFKLDYKRLSYYSKEWEENMIKNIGEKAFNSEYKLLDEKDPFVISTNDRLDKIEKMLEEILKKLS